MTKAAELAKMGEVLTNSQIGGRRNMVINGDMQVAQRNSSSAVTITGDGIYTTVDRFKGRTFGGSGRFSMQQVTDTPNKSFTNALKLVVTTTDTSGTNGYAIETILETNSVTGTGWGGSNSNAKKATISFHVKSSITGTYSAALRLDTGSGEPSNVAEFTIDSANTWEKKTITFPAYTGSDSVNNCIINFGLGKQTSKTTSTLLTWQTTNFVYGSNQVDWQSNSGATFFITGIQFEVGEQATPFEHRSFGEELVLCQRYYHRHVSDGSSQNMFGVGFCDGSTNATMQIHFPTTMRDQPSALETTGTAGDYAIREGGGAVITCNAVPTMSGDTTPNVAVLGFTTSGSLTADSGCMGRAVSSGVHLSFTAEL